VLVVGPSGSGKDTLIGMARAELKHEPRFIFPRRVITRQAQQDAEDHDTLSVEEFTVNEANGYFALCWGAHGLRYGIPAQSLAGLANGQVAIINVSRRAILDAEELGIPVTVISILCDPAQLAERIAKRGRETADEIAIRIRREAPIEVREARLIEIHNDKRPEDALNNFLEAIRST
jgi:phosphonate metabolism protein PhnN/1,5-bisphosphokinase (PRPP-forming)